MLRATDLPSTIYNSRNSLQFRKTPGSVTQSYGVQQINTHMKVNLYHEKKRYLLKTVDILWIRK